MDMGIAWSWETCPTREWIVEEPLGPYELQLLRLSGAEPNVYEYAENMDMK